MLDIVSLPDSPVPDTLPMLKPSLATTARRSMERTFEAGGHCPSTGQWEAIQDYLEHAERAANGQLDAKVFLSAIPAGTGKSVAVAAISKAVAASPDHGHVGVLIAVNRIAEAEDMATALQPVRSSLHMATGKAKAALMLPLGGHMTADQAQIVVTTQAALKETLRRSKDFDQAARYHYRGRRRAVILWDEAVAFNRPVVLDNDAVGSLAKALRRQSPEAVAALKEWSAALEKAPKGLCEVPDFAAMGVDFGRLEQEAETDEQATQARALSIIAGERGHVLRSNLDGSSLVTHIPELPPSLMPMIVTDASAAKGVHHDSYAMMAQAGLPLAWLKEASKSYTNLTLRIVPMAASRSAYRKNGSHEGRTLIDVMVRYVQSVAPERVLVVSYKSAMAIHGVRERTIKDAVNARLSDADRSRTDHITWGSHTATNAHARTAHVIFAGLNFAPPSAAYATAGAALALPMNTEEAKDHPTADQVRDMGRGMLRDSTLQAVLRGAARTGLNGDCGRQEVVIPQAPQTGLTKADYQGMFPGVRIIQDTSLLPARPLKGNLKRLAAEVQRRQGEGAKEITDASLYAELGISQGNYGKLKRKPEWAAWLSASGWHQAKLAKGAMGLRRP